MKVTYTRILARKILLAFLTITILFSIAAFFVRSTITKKLENIARLAGNAESDQSKPEKVLLLLHEAEGDFQESLLNVNSKKNIDYKIKLTLAFNEIDTLLKAETDTTQLTSVQRVKVKLWYREKLKLSDKLFELRHSFDSLLTTYADFNTQAGIMKGADISEHSFKNSVKNSTDTVHKTVPGVKKGFFKRIKEAIANKNGTSGSKEYTEINHNSKVNEVDLNTQKVLARNEQAYSNKLKLLQQHNQKMLDLQKKLIILNTHVTSELERIINDVKDINYNMTDEFKGMAFKNYQETTALLNKLYLVALFIILAFAALLIIFIIQLNKSEILLRKENERSVAIAQQKMDLLLHMSHEIRNPLTAIKGFLYIFSQTTLSQKQGEMLDSIRLSSDMLLRTLNDTLDAAKMENSEFKINNEPFNPDYTLKMVIESMEFSAAKKKLTMAYNFTGDKEAIVSGDSFRLKQILVNLLSNAIKYTAKGGVTVNAELVSEENILKVDICDTGAGINLEQQAHLFSKYYQTNSSKGQVGTGLGLYICKQLIELQGGKITVSSKPDSGTVFSFSIPYQKSENNSNAKEGVEEKLLSINGITILAVDDNEINLLFLKMMTNKWNVKFLQASNGKEALDIIAKNAVTVVLTDIQMPEMGGNELLAAIKKLEKPLNQTPVIVISGSVEPGEVKKILKMGFSGMVGKPFVEADLIKQILQSLNKPEKS